MKRVESNDADWTTSEEYRPIGNDGEDSDTVADMMGTLEVKVRKRKDPENYRSEIPSPPQKRAARSENRKLSSGTRGR